MQWNEHKLYYQQNDKTVKHRPLANFCHIVVCNNHLTKKVIILSHSNIFITIFWTQTEFTLITTGLSFIFKKKASEEPVEFNNSE